ncbi:MAG: aldose epimerase family protein [Candidatus Cryptobacteroides sp.]
MNHRFFAGAAAALLVVSCCRDNAPALIPAANFDGEVDGKPVALYTLKGGDVTLQVTNFGARVVSIFTPDRNGKYEDIVVGYNNLKDYVTPPGERFLGACVGPVANRIANASFTVDGVEYNVPANDNGVNTLHGGYKGLDNVVWDVNSVNDSSIVLHYLHADGQEGFPGNKDITMTYTVTSANEFRVDYKASTDKTTPINISNHPFFCLRGEGNGTVEDYIMHIKASHYIPIDSLSIPTGAIDDVSGTPFDFRRAHRIGEMIGEDNIQLKNARGYDHNWCIDRETESGVEMNCTVYDPETGRQVDVLSDQPGIQFYSGNFFQGTSTGKYGRPLGFRSSLALETQHYPDSPNHPDFPSVLIEPGQTYTQICVYRFSVHQ